MALKLPYRRTRLLPLALVALAAAAVAAATVLQVAGYIHVAHLWRRQRPAIAAPPSPARPPPLRSILVWRDNHKHVNLGSGLDQDQDAFRRAGCREHRCYLTHSRTRMPPEDYDAVVFHARYLSVSKDPSKNVGIFPPARRPEQRYVFLITESPKNTKSDLKGMNHVFNWTMTYRLDSDVPARVGSVVARDGSEAGVVPSAWARPPDPPLRPGVLQPIPKGKRRPLVAWLVSHCRADSQREKYVSALSKHVEVSVYGKCGTAWRSDRDAFYRMISSRQYKFYLSFENSVCTDYVTEKFFNILRYKVVPVVLGGANYSQHAPPYSYIDVRGFKGPKELAQYLVFLDQNPEEYAKYFWWKDLYEPVDKFWEPLCQLCQMLHEDLRHKSYADIGAWWRNGTCKDPYTWAASDT